MTSVRIVDEDPRWAADFVDVARRLRSTLGDRASRIDHIGSTAVSGLAAKDVIDIQVSTVDRAQTDTVAGALVEAGWVRDREISFDHDVPGLPRGQRKVFFTEPGGMRRVNLHVRVIGRPNQRYPLVVRDYLRSHPNSAEAYAALKRDLAATFPDDSDRYADTKDAACDLIYFAAEDWAQATGWHPGSPDA